MASPRLFTLEEATSVLRRLEPLIRDLQQAKHQLDQIAGAVGGIVRISQGNGDISDQMVAEAGPEDRFQELRGRIEAGLDEIQSLGCVVKDLDLGLVDFPSLREGEVVYLCWRLGEESIAYWHDLESGFAGRRPL